MYSSRRNGKVEMLAKMQGLAPGSIVGLMFAMHEQESVRESFPCDDTTDFSNGARFIPSEVTYARRDDKQVDFVQPCRNPNCWYWLFVHRHGKIDGGTRIYHYDGLAFDTIMDYHGVKREPESGMYCIDENRKYPCPRCGNEFTAGVGHGYVYEENGVLTGHKI